MEQVTRLGAGPPWAAGCCGGGALWRQRWQGQGRAHYAQSSGLGGWCRALAGAGLGQGPAPSARVAHRDVVVATTKEAEEEEEGLGTR